MRLIFVHPLRLILKTTKYQEKQLEKSFRCIFYIHNVIVKLAQKQLNRMRNDPDYKQLIKEYVKNKGLLKKTVKNKNHKLVKRYKATECALLAERNRLIEKYMLTKIGLESYASVQQGKFSHLVSSFQAQKEAARVYAGLKKILFSDGKKLHFRKLSKTTTISGKDPRNGVRYYDEFHKDYYKKDVTPKHSAEIEFCGMQIEVNLDLKDEYIFRAIQGDLSYCDLKRLRFNDGWHYYVVLMVRDEADDEEAKKDKKYKHKEPFKAPSVFKHPAPLKVQGMDLGVSTVAVVSDDNAILKELAPKSKEYEDKINALNRSIDKSKRKLNPDNYNPDGTCKKGKRKWIVSKRCLRKMIKVSVLHRQKAEYVRQNHFEQANEVLADGCEIYTEKMDFKGLQRRAKKTERQEKATEIKTKDGQVKEVRKYKKKKRWGHSLSNRAPSSFLTILKSKAECYGGFVKEVNTSKFKASQYDHHTNTYTKVPLSQRSKIIDNVEVQRDLYSAFLLKNTNQNLDTPDRSKCIEEFPNFVKVTQQLIITMKVNNISMPRCFGF